GERMKVAIGRALVHRPRNLILDEPTNGLDVMSTRAMRQLLRTLRDDGCCVLFSSHVMQEVSALCSHIVIVADGRVVASGSASALQQQAGVDSLEELFVQLTLAQREAGW
ncbi:MAG TPA: ABC transporter, partial [Sorangium sp.]|nr:ABC transporter [Sorangium sp.]